ncbi:MAG TPA: cation-transporting P-type ATPase, partial [Arachnia sp.]|nr:cation-transporting P-type ATPase [Arachnia sp.]
MTITPTEATPWAEQADAVAASLGSSAAGLTTADVDLRLERDGGNELPTPAPKPAWLRFLAHFNDLLVYILIAAAALKAISGDWIDFTVIAVVIVATALIGFIQEGRAASALASLQTMQSQEAQALRDGTWGVVDAATLVAGDIVRLRSGDRVPADLRLVTASSLQADEAALTGESVPSQKEVDAVEAGAGVGDRTSMLFSGTLITTGTAEGVVVATGGRPPIGNISALVAGQDKLETPPAPRLNR